MFLSILLIAHFAFSLYSWKVRNVCLVPIKGFYLYFFFDKQKIKKQTNKQKWNKSQKKGFLGCVGVCVCVCVGLWVGGVWGCVYVCVRKHLPTVTTVTISACFVLHEIFKGCGMCPWLVLVSPCFRGNGVATWKIGSFLCSLDNLLQKNVIVSFFFFFFEIKFQNGTHLKKGVWNGSTACTSFPLFYGKYSCHMQNLVCFV